MTDIPYGERAYSVTVKFQWKVVPLFFALIFRETKLKCQYLTLPTLENAYISVRNCFNIARLSDFLMFLVLVQTHQDSDTTELVQ